MEWQLAKLAHIPCLVKPTECWYLDTPEVIVVVASALHSRFGVQLWRLLPVWTCGATKVEMDAVLALF